MKTSIIVLTGFVLLALGGFILFSNDSPEESNLESSQQLEQTPQQQETTSGSGGKYVEYSDDVLVANADKSRVLFFHANWCSTCKTFENEIEKNGVPEGITVIKVDYDTSQELKKQYGVNVQSTFVLLDENGNLVKKWPFGQGIQNMADLYNQVLASQQV